MVVDWAKCASAAQREHEGAYGGLSFAGCRLLALGVYGGLPVVDC
jgi:hypothetical protein